MIAKKFLAFILSVLMIVSVMPATIFAAPAMVTVIETTDEAISHEHEHSAEGAAELAAVNESWKKDVYKTFENGLYTLKDTYVICNTCKSYVYVANDYSHSIYLDYINPDYSTPGKVTFTFKYCFSDCNGQVWYSDEKTTTVEFNCETALAKTIFAKVNNQYAYTMIRRDVSTHTGNATCSVADNCTLCGTSYIGDHSYFESYTQAEVDGILKHRRMCTSGCGNYTDEGICSGSGTPTCITPVTCSTCKNIYINVSPTNHAEGVNDEGIYTCCGLGTEPAVVNGVYQISTAGQLVWFRDYVNGGSTDADAVLLNDIDLSGISWTPIGNDSNRYTGTFDGKGFDISSFKMTVDTNGDFGLFGTVSDAVIKDFSISGEASIYYIEDFSELNYGVIGEASGNTIVTNVHSSVNLTVAEDIEFLNTVGGIIGRNNSSGADFAIERCSFDGKLDLGITKVDCTGGIVGYLMAGNTAKINNCLFNGEIVSDYDGTLQLGGIIGYYRMSKLTITNCLSIGTITCTDYTTAGMLAGVLRQHSNANTMLTNNYYTGTSPFGNSVEDDDITDGYNSQTAGASATAVYDRDLEGCGVAYKLGDAWGQEYGVDLIPVIGGIKVYGGYESCANESMIYRNTPLSETRPEHDYDNGVCTVCYHEVVAKVGDVYYETLDEAVAAATGENATVTLVSNVELSEQLVITSGTFTLDLNGKTLSSEGFALNICGTADVKITDSSEEKNGAIFTSGDRFDTITLYDSAKLEIAGGTISSHNGKVISMSYAGNACEAELVVSGGTLFTNNYYVIFAKGKKVTVIGGELHGEESEIYYSNGSIDLSAYQSVLGFELYTDSSFDESVFDVDIPEEYTFDVVTETSALGVTSTRYTVIRNPELYIPAELLRLEDNTNIRYAEINGIQKEIEAVDDIYYVRTGEENLLIEFVEKTANGEFVKSQYFYVDMTEKTATNLNLDSYMTTDGKKSIRTKTPMGIRFRADITDTARQEDTAFVIDEYGYIIALEEHLNGEELTFDFSRHVTGVAYNKADGTDVVFSQNDGVTTFTGVLHGIPAAKYKTNIVSKTYTKITVGGEQFVLYGEAVTGNVYDTAQTLLSKEDIDEETRSALSQIILDYENEAGFDYGELATQE